MTVYMRGTGAAGLVVLGDLTAGVCATATEVETTNAARSGAGVGSSGGGSRRKPPKEVSLTVAPSGALVTPLARETLRYSVRSGASMSVREKNAALRWVSLTAVDSQGG